jgi:low temperature requirement protein LtrA
VTGTEPGGGQPLRVSTLELFFDLVFVFAITQLTGILSHRVTVLDGARVLLVFGALWWMYDGYVWLSNARTPARTTERLLMLLGMAGFLIVGLAIPHAFGRDGVAFGLGYLTLVCVHTGLYWRVNRNIARVTPFNLATALLIIGAGVAGGWAAYVLWAAALALLALSPLIVRVRGRFDVQPSHFAERHGALIIIVFGESVVDIGVGAEGHPVTVPLALSALLGLALVAALWWVYFGVGDDERAEQAMLAADPAARPALAFSAYFYPYIPMLLVHPDAARRRRPGLRGEAGRREPRQHAAGRAVRGAGLRGRAVPGRHGGRPARAADRGGALPAGRGGGVPGRLGGRRGGERGGRDGAADGDRGGRARRRAAGAGR